MFHCVLWTRYKYVKHREFEPYILGVVTLITFLYTKQDISESNIYNSCMCNRPPRSEVCYIINKYVVYPTLLGWQSMRPLPYDIVYPCSTTQTADGTSLQQQTETKKEAAGRNISTERFWLVQIYECFTKPHAITNLEKKSHWSSELFVGVKGTRLGEICYIFFCHQLIIPETRSVCHHRN